MENIGSTTEGIIGNWITETMQTGSWEKFNDLHVDDIENTIASSKDQWLHASLIFFNIANSLLPNKKDFLVALMVPLEGQIDWQNISYLALTEYLDQTPPSLYLMHREWDNWKETLQESKAIALMGIETHIATHVSQQKGGSSVLIIF